MTALKTLVFLILVPGTVAGLVPYGISRWRGGLPGGELGVWRHLGWLLVIPGVTALLWSMFEFVTQGKGTPAPIDPPKRFVATGLYRFVRNPMYVGVLAALAGQSMLYQSLNVLAYAALVWLIVHVFVVFYEEPTLRRMFGDEYANYWQRVPRWLPRVPGADRR